MTGASKILTVSYGTFSCTLEGFDEPFNTMKAIAEYFRDLAADDRYFGAEPPTPDAAMLHRIAEREVQRRVEAKIQENGVILRAGDAEAAPEPAPRPTLVAVETNAASVAAKLQRIREKHAPATTTATIAAVPAPAEEIYTEDEHAEAMPAVTSADVVHVVEEIEHDDQSDTKLTGVDAAVADEPALDAAEFAMNAPVADTGNEAMIDFSDQFADLPEAEDFDLPEDVVEVYATDAADDLALIEGLSAELAADSLPEDEPVATDALPEDLLEDMPENLPENLPEDLAEALPEAVEESDDDYDEDALLETLADAPVPQVAAETQPVTEPVADEVDMLARLGTLIDPVDQENLTDADDAEIAPAAPVPDEALLAALSEPMVTAEPAAPQSAAPQPAAPRARARVIRIRRAEPAAAPAAEAAPESAPEYAAPVAAKPEVSADQIAESTASALSDEDEAALQAELAALEAELGGGFDIEDAPAPTAEPAAVAEFEIVDQENQRKRPGAPDRNDAVGRLMAQAQTEMVSQETVRRQSAIAHLKAAVAATEADRKAGVDDSAQRGPRIDVYRDDLERVVRPRRPVAEGSTPRPGQVENAQRATPLVLVSEQRIDRPKAVPAGETHAAAPRAVMPVRPRRVQSEISAVASSAGAARQEAAEMDADEELMGFDDADNVFSDATSFEDFADQLGATNLPELLEAAAVYCAEVLQRPEFSRPLVMRQVAGLPSSQPLNREDCLRGFGTLLRQGRIAKVKRGMFALTDRSPYLAEARKLAG